MTVKNKRAFLKTYVSRASPVERASAVAVILMKNELIAVIFDVLLFPKIQLYTTCRST